MLPADHLEVGQLQGQIARHSQSLRLPGCSIAGLVHWTLLSSKTLKHFPDSTSLYRSCDVCVSRISCFEVTTCRSCTYLILHIVLGTVLS